MLFHLFVSSLKNILALGTLSWWSVGYILYYYVIRGSQDVILFFPSSLTSRHRKQTVFNNIKVGYILHTVQVITCHSCGIYINFQELKRNSGELSQTLKKKIMKTLVIERLHSQDKSAHYKLNFLYRKIRAK